MQACSPKILTCLTFITPFLLQGFVWQLTNPELATALAQNRIINGTAVNPPHKYPWTVSIYHVGCFSTGECSTLGHHCGGAVLDGHFVITAAHCCYPDPTKPGQIDIKGMYVITGIHERNKLTPWSQNLSIAECIPHELYRFNRSDMLHDIALVRVNGKIEFNENVTPTNLPSPDFEVDTDSKVTATMVGWGFVKDNPIEFPKELQQVELPLITTDTCQRTFGLVDLFGRNVSNVVTDAMVCVGFSKEGKGGCLQDSGSPVMIQNPLTKAYTQIGIVSWTITPCGSNPTVCTRLSSYVHWIQSHVQKCQPRSFEGQAQSG